MQVAAVSIRAGLDNEIYHRALLEAHRQGPIVHPFARQVRVDEDDYVVGGTDPRLYVVFTLPFAGHADEYKVVAPFATIEEFAAMLGCSQM